MEFWDFLKPYVVGQPVSQLVLSILISNNHVPLHLLWEKHSVRYPQVPKYYKHGCKFGEWQKCTPLSPPLSKDEGLRDIGHSMSIRNLILGVNSVIDTQ